MPKSKLFSSIALAMTFALAATGVFAKPAKVMPSSEPTVTQLTTAHRATTNMFRDDTEEMTLRWMYSSDGGENWSGMKDAGVTGMIDTSGGEPQAGWGSASYDFGAVVDAENKIHFAVVLDSYLADAERVNGVYDVRCSADGQTVDYYLIAEEAEGMDFVWSDCGINADGDIFVIWVDLNESTATIYGSKSANGGEAWSGPFMIKAIDVGGAGASEMPYAHMTTLVGADNFYIVYQAATEEGWAHHVLTVPSALAGEVTDTETGGMSGTYVSYYTGAVNPIAMDINTNDVYFGFRNEDLTGTGVGVMTGPGEFSIGVVSGAQRYPSVGLDMANEMPWVFSNNGVSNPHFDWYAYDDLGYNGGSWTDRIGLDSVEYNGTRDLLYTHLGVWTSSGRLVSGCNIWGQFTPEGFQVNYSDDGGETWAGPTKLWSIFDEESPLSGGFITQNHLLAGADNYVFVALCGKVGATDFDGPDVAEAGLENFSMEFPFVVNCDLNDLNGIGYTDVNWLWAGDAALPDSLQYGWDYMPADSVIDPDALDNGMYYYTIPNDTLNGHAIVNGDSVWFFIYAQDQLGNASMGWENLLIVGTGYQGVWEPIVIPNSTSLGQNYPNPFNNSTVIPFALNKSQSVKIQVWDTNGRLVSTLFDGREMAGNHEIAWNTEGLTSGIYIYTLETKSERFVGKMSLLH